MPGSGIHLGHRRLSIIDLSPQGHQSMASADGRFVNTFNGEICNYLQLRQEIADRRDTPPVYRGHSDTEILVALIVELGLEAALERCVGMFAFVLWERELWPILMFQAWRAVEPSRNEA